MRFLLNCYTNLASFKIFLSYFFELATCKLLPPACSVELQYQMGPCRQVSSTGASKILIMPECECCIKIRVL